MTSPVAQILTDTVNGEPVRSLQTWCPGCDAAHTVTLDGPIGQRPPVAWDWDGNLTQPTLSPAILTETITSSGTVTRCHGFIINGQWVYLPDSGHTLAGQVAAMVPLPATAA